MDEANKYAVSPEKLHAFLKCELRVFQKVAPTPFMHGVGGSAQLFRCSVSSLNAFSALPYSSNQFRERLESP